MRVAMPLVLVLLVPLAAAAQAPAPPVENVQVEASKIPQEQGVHDFIAHAAQPALFLGKISRWRQPICPQTQGFIEPVSASVTTRVRKVAADIGAPVDANPRCKPNVLIYFTRDPQGLLDELVRRDESTLGFHYVSQTRALATISHPIQAWYATATRDANGELSLDVDNMEEMAECAKDATSEFKRSPQMGLLLFKRCSYPTAGTRGSLRDGMRSEMGRVTIVADSNRLDAYDSQTLADYVALLALTRVDAFGGCQGLLTISNLLAGCPADRVSRSLSEVDLAYLRALYHTDPTLSLQLQQSAIEHEMVDAFRRK